MAARNKIRQASRLRYGQTPWDRLSRTELLLMVCRYHDALSSAASCLRVMRCQDDNSPYWALPGGEGGRALAKWDFLDTISSQNSDTAHEKIYRAFFRSAGRVLFPGVNLGGWHKWWICEACGQMSATADTFDGKPKRPCHCSDSEWRPFRLSDIRPDLGKVEV